jgi:hypothetical protein
MKHTGKTIQQWEDVGEKQSSLMAAKCSLDEFLLVPFQNGPDPRLQIVALHFSDISSIHVVVFFLVVFGRWWWRLFLLEQFLAVQWTCRV